jgi:hypothetical protein
MLTDKNKVHGGHKTTERKIIPFKLWTIILSKALKVFFFLITKVCFMPQLWRRGTVSTYSRVSICHGVRRLGVSHGGRVGRHQGRRWRHRRHTTVCKVFRRFFLAVRSLCVPSFRAVHTWNKWKLLIIYFSLFLKLIQLPSFTNMTFPNMEKCECSFHIQFPSFTHSPHS